MTPFLAPVPRPCPACGSLDHRPALAAQDYMLELDTPFYVSRCGECGLWFQNPRIPSEALGAHYPASYGPYRGSEMQVGGAVRRYLRRDRGYSHLEVPRTAFSWPGRGRYAAETLLLPDFVPGGRLLEIGCASGARLSLLRDLGWEHCTGIEYDEAASARARARGFTVLTGTVESLLDTIEDSSLDVVLAGFLLEHLEDPFAVTRRIAAKLKPGGQFLFSTVNVESPDFRLYGKYWYNLDLPRHHVFFRPRDLTRLLGSDFHVERVTGIAAPNDYAGSARYRLRHAPRFYDRFVARARNRLLPVCLLLAWLGLSSRVAIRSRRNG